MRTSVFAWVRKWRPEGRFLFGDSGQLAGTLGVWGKEMERRSWRLLEIGGELTTFNCFISETAGGGEEEVRVESGGE